MKETRAILFIYRHPLRVNAPTIMEHANAFEKYSSFDIVSINNVYGFPKGIQSLRFSAIILHYSCFSRHPFPLGHQFAKYVSESSCTKIAFFQDEMQHCKERFEYINWLGIDIVYSLLEPRYFNTVYCSNSRAEKVLHTLTGYVCDTLINKAESHQKDFEKREIDVGYRARSLPYFYGEGAQEKRIIGEEFLRLAGNSNLRLDISSAEKDRIYGDAWYAFVSNCRFMLGVMAGTSVFDLTGDAENRVDEYCAKNPNASFSHVRKEVLAPFEGKIRYRTISPRIFECAALKTCMVLYRDDYQGVLEADKHYIALEKDFSNFDSVLDQMRNSDLVNRIVSQAYEDLIEAGKWHYRGFIAEFDTLLASLDCAPCSSRDELQFVNKRVNEDKLKRFAFAWLKEFIARYLSPNEKLRYLIYNLGSILRS